MKNFKKFDESVQQEIRSSEQYYREQIFSSGCSSLVPIYRISSANLTIDLLLKQLNGSPYIQKDVRFSENVIASLIDVELYRYEEFHFFFTGDIPKKLESFVNKHCRQLNSISELVESDLWAQQPEWCNFEKDIPSLIAKYPILKSLDLAKLSKQLFNTLKDLDIPPTVKGHMAMYTTDANWRDKFLRNQCSLYFMAEMANQMNLGEREIASLSVMGLVKDIGYVRLSQQIDDFEAMHPLVSYKLLQEATANSRDDSIFSADFVSSILVHHEFVDGSGPLARMKHPLVTSQLANGISKVSQISGISDLYFGFLNDYSPTLAFSLACGFVLGQGNLPSKYDAAVVELFSSVVAKGELKNSDVPQVEATKLLQDILGLLKEDAVRIKTEKMISLKCRTWHEKITLALNVVRNIASYQPQHLNEKSLEGVLNLPIEFGLNY